jgi:hypothetical protein
VEFFSSTSCDPSGHGQGQQFFVAQTLMTNASGDATFSNSLPFPLPVGVFITATATSPGNDTSEFSACAQVSDLTPVQIQDVSWSGSDNLTWTAGADADSYEVFRGRSSFLPNLVNGAMESCLRTSTASPTTGNVLTETPGAGVILWFIAVGVNAFGTGTAGQATVGPRSLDSFGNCDTCLHDKCDVGPPLSSSCDTCVTSICSANPSCCSTSWNDTCVDMVRSTCGSLACEPSQGACGHLQCVTGGFLADGCDDPPVSPSCVTDICTVDTVCCSGVWDSLCVDTVVVECGLVCN